AGFAATLCAIGSLGLYHGASMENHQQWTAATMALAATIPLTVLIIALPTPLLVRMGLKIPLASHLTRLSGRLPDDSVTRITAARFARAAAGIAIVIMMAWLIGVKVADESHFLHAAVIGLAAGFVAWWLARDLSRDSESVYLNGLAALVILCG